MGGLRVAGGRKASPGAGVIDRQSVKTPETRNHGKREICGYDAGKKVKDALAATGDWTIEIIKRSDTAKGFDLLPRRWGVGRTLARLNRNRRRAKDFETTIASAWPFCACVQRMTRRTARQTPQNIGF